MCMCAYVCVINCGCARTSYFNYEIWQACHNKNIRLKGKQQKLSALNKETVATLLFVIHLILG